MFIQFIVLILQNKMTNYYSLKVNYLEKSTPNSIIVGFEIPSELKNKFKFKAGQYISIEKKINENLVRRSYSICEEPSLGKLLIAVKKLKNGLFSSYLNNEIKLGDSIKVSPPEGRFIYEPIKKVQSLVAFAAGSGITPVFSILKSSLKNKSINKIILIYSNKSVEETMFYSELKEFEKKYSNKLSIYWLYSREKNKGSLFGRIDKSNFNYLFPKFKNFNSLFYLCGPRDMIMNIQKLLIEKKINEKKIKYELFTGLNDKVTLPQEIKKNHSFNLTIIYDEIKYDIKIKKSQTILDCSIENNLDVPYSCQGGVCSSCIAKLKNGKIEMLDNQILTDEEIKDGLVLTCQSIPSSDNITIDYDEV